MSGNEMEFEKLFKISTTSMRINGSHPDLKKNLFWKIQLTAIIINFVSCLILLLVSLFFYDIPSRNYEESCKNAIVSIVGTIFFFKIYILLKHKKSIKYLITTMSEDFKMFEHLCEEEKNVMREYAQRGVKVCYIWLIGAVSTSSPFALKAFILMAYKYWHGEFELVPMYNLRFPGVIEEYKYDPIVYYPFFLASFFYAVLCSTIYIGFDPLIGIFLLHSSGQLDVLRKRILNIFNETSNHEDIERKLKSIIIKHQQIYRFMDVIRVNYPTMFEYIMKTCTLIIPFCLFQIQTSLQRKEFNIEFTTFICSATIHFYLPCYYSDVIMDKSESMRQAIYSCGWQKYHNIKIRKTVLIMLMRTTKPLSVGTVFDYLCLETFAKMCNQAYAIFNIMNASLRE